ncbi:MAG: hypothetical protein FJX67_18965 [Alphaproteobacteria bacterium]|nr:hypothetical protein [Alphaproteobacteria bacterium]
MRRPVDDRAVATIGRRLGPEREIAVEDAIGELRLDPRSVVVDRKLGAPTLAAEPHLDDAVRRREAQRVVDEVLDHRLEEIGAAVAALPDRQRAALTLCHYEGMSNAEAAGVLGVSVGAAESLLVRARKDLRTRLAATRDEERG